MVQISKTGCQEILFVGLNNWHKQITDLLDGSSRQIRWCDTVYDAIAVISNIAEVEAHINGPHDGAQIEFKCPGQTIVSILIDNLSSEDMKVFSCLGQISNVETIAISALASRSKLKYAQQMGSGQVMLPGEFGRFLKALDQGAIMDNGESGGQGQSVAETTQTTDQSPSDEQKRVNDIEESQEDRVQTKEVTVGDTDDLIEKAKSNESIPLLSQDELDSLLGS